jgi:hypothetical protein
MNIKKFIFSLLFASAPLSAMNLVPGTVIDPLHHTGQFTVSVAQNVTCLPSGLPSVLCQVSKASSDIFKNKGVPVLIYTAAGMVPWWALTTGTGYLIISQCGISDPGLLTSIVSGASYAAGQQSNSVLKKYITNPYVKSFAQVALCASCLGLSYISGNSVTSDALLAVAQAIGLQTIFDNCLELLMKIKVTHSYQSQSQKQQAWCALSPALKANLINGTVDALSIILPSLCISNECDPNMILRILLYEQAYRLAQYGCAAAQHFINK